MTSKRCAFCSKRAVYTYRSDIPANPVPFCNWHLTVLWLGLKAGEWHD